MKKIIDWLVKSSADKEKTSLTVKGVLTGLIPVVIVLANLTSVDISNEQLASVIDAISALVFLVSGIVSALMTISGLLRKIYTTITGRNEVINDYKAQGK